MKRTEFLEQVARVAVADYARSKVLPSLTIAQAILESGWGNSGLARVSKNLFGIKAGKSWKGAKRSYPTKEFYGGKWVTIDAYFREYSTFEGSIKDHNDLMQNKRYHKVLKAKDYMTACTEVWKAGYATDPNYPALLARVIKQFRLDEYDKQVVDYMLAKKDAEKIIRLIQDKYATAKTDAERDEWHRVANEVRKASGQG